MISGFTLHAVVPEGVWRGLVVHAASFPNFLTTEFTTEFRSSRPQPVVLEKGYGMGTEFRSLSELTENSVVPDPIEYSAVQSKKHKTSVLSIFFGIFRVLKY